MIPIIAMILVHSLKIKHDSIKALAWVLIVLAAYFLLGLLI
jgi:hypothetical protein